MGLDITKETFRIGEAARFFDQKQEWWRWREGKGFIKDVDGNPIGTRLKSKGTKKREGDRVYTLEDLSKLAESFYVEGILTDKGYRTVMQRIEAFQIPVETGRRKPLKL